jgi:hypothetical protein
MIDKIKRFFKNILFRAKKNKDKMRLFTCGWLDYSATILRKKNILLKLKNLSGKEHLERTSVDGSPCFCFGKQHSKKPKNN